MPTYVRRLDWERVEAVQWTGTNVYEIVSLVGGYRVDVTDIDTLILTHPGTQDRVEVAQTDWVVRDDKRVYAVPPWSFGSHCRGVTVG